MTRRHLIEGLAPPISPSSHATEARGLVFMTGQIGRDLQDPAAPLPEGISAQTTIALGNVRTVLGALGLGLDDILNIRAYLVRFGRDYEAMNGAYDAFFHGTTRPARTCVGVAELARSALVEVECIAARPVAKRRPTKIFREMYSVAQGVGVGR